MPKTASVQTKLNKLQQDLESEQVSYAPKKLTPAENAALTVKL